MQNEDDVSADDKMIDRLISMTIDAALGWEPYYGQVRIGSSEDEMRAATAPKAFVLAQGKPDEFGMITVQMKNAMEEIIPEDPKVFVNGERLAVSDRKVETLVEAINVYLEEVRTGETLSPQQKYQARERNLRKQFNQQLESLYAQLDNREERIDQLMNTINRLTQFADPKPPRPQMTVDELKEVIWELYSDQYDIPREVFEENFNTAEASHILRRRVSD